MSQWLACVFNQSRQSPLCFLVSQIRFIHLSSYFKDRSNLHCVIFILFMLPVYLKKCHQKFCIKIGRITCDAVTLLKECVTDVTRMLFCPPVTFTHVTGMSQPSQDSIKHCFIKELSRSLLHTRLSQERCHRSRSSFSCSSPAVA